MCRVGLGWTTFGTSALLGSPGELASALQRACTRRKGGHNCDGYTFSCASKDLAFCGVLCKSSCATKSVKAQVDAALANGEILGLQVRVTSGSQHTLHFLNVIGKTGADYIMFDPAGSITIGRRTYTVRAAQLFGKGVPPDMHPTGWGSGPHFTPRFWVEKLNSKIQQQQRVSRVRALTKTIVTKPSKRTPLVEELHSIATFTCDRQECGCGSQAIHNGSYISGTCGADGLGKFESSTFNGSHILVCAGCTDAACSQNCDCKGMKPDTCTPLSRPNGSSPLVAVHVTRASWALPPPPPNYFLGRQGESCSNTCSGKQLTCSPHVETNNSNTIFKALGVKCGALRGAGGGSTDRARWWAADQPSYCSDPKDPNLGMCLGYQDAPQTSDCGASYWSVRRLCYCVSPS